MRDLSALSDQELVIETVNGDSAAYGCLYDRYVAQIFRFVYFRVGNKEDADDLVELVFLRTYERLMRSREAIESIKPWLYRTANNLVIDHYRADKNSLSLDQVGPLHDQQSSPETAFISKEDQWRLKSAMEKLDPDQQMIIIYRFIQGLSHEETAQIMGLKADNLRVIQYRTLQKLRGIMKESVGHE
jgi:RNA polymerase sigma-70 factor, ECF subfamily